MEQFKLTECKIRSKTNLSFPGVFACRVRHSQLSVLSLLVNRLTVLLVDQMNLNQYSSLLWMEGMGQVNPLATDEVANVVVANGGLTSLILKVGMLINTN